MALLKLKSLAITATQAAAPLSATDKWAGKVWVQNIDSANEAFLGDSTLTAAAGWQLLKGESLAVDPLMGPTHVKNRLNLKDLYCICSSGETATLRVAYISEENE